MRFWIWVVSLFTGRAPSFGRSALATSPRTPQEALAYLKTIVTPHAPRAVMEAAIHAAYFEVPGYQHAYKDCVCLFGVWVDLIENYQEDKPRWRKRSPKFSITHLELFAKETRKPDASLL